MISIIIPTLNEAALLSSTLSAIAANLTTHEMLVADGGSADETVRLAEAAGARVVRCPAPHRARQMNRAAQEAQGDMLLFLHADTWLQPDSLHQVRVALERQEVVGGGFCRQFAGASRLLRLSCRIAEYRCRFLGWFFGDQALFARRAVFDRLGGFADLPLFEDLDFSRRLGREGRLVTLRPGIVSSRRRFDRRGVLATILADTWLTCRYLAGADANTLR